jgi:hypothetical protein
MTGRRKALWLLAAVAVFALLAVLIVVGWLYVPCCAPVAPHRFGGAALPADATRIRQLHCQRPRLEQLVQCAEHCTDARGDGVVMCRGGTGQEACPAGASGARPQAMKDGLT